MEIMQQKKMLIERILPYLTEAPSDAAQRLLGQSASDLETILDDAITKKARAQATQQVEQHAAEMRRASQFDAAFVHACRMLINNRYLCSTDSNRAILESLLNPGETASAKLYVALAEQFPKKFAWETPSAPASKQDVRAAFDVFVRENNLSSVEANFNLFKEGASAEHYAGASQIERAQYAHEAAQARQTFLTNNATPSQLKAEAAFQSQTEHDAAVQAEADRSHQFVLSQQQHYPALPSTNANGEAIDAAYLRKISTINFPLFKQLVKKHGSGNVTARLRGEN
jgi:hypothetical protein